jgi:hypothetical protein
MATQSQEIDFTSLIATLNALIQTIGLNGRALSGILAASAAVDYFHISGAGTFEVQGAAGTLLSININSDPIGGTGTLYDASSPASLIDVIGVLNFGTVAPLPLPIGPDGKGTSLNNGLVIVTTGTADITVFTT